ncbi:MAG: T9SS type A sorting domain-containing protein [Bacteroidetes bacterium]|nr:T9SS type A sorting domain-containing protein [Bacteroidota bacterium]
MKKIHLTLFAMVAFAGMKAASYTITIIGTSYSPATLTVNVGDVVTLIATPNHPTNEVDQTTWNANGTATVSGGWGIQASAYTFTVSNLGNIYYVCQNHVSMGMKGVISVANPNGLVQSFSNIQNLSVFPNPASEKLSISYNILRAANMSFKLYSVTGREVAVLSADLATITGEITLDLLLPTGLSNGIYILHIVSHSKTETKKILVLK